MMVEKDGENGGEPSSPSEAGENEANVNEEEKDQSLIEEVKEVVDNVETSLLDLFHNKEKDTPVEPKVDAAISIESRDVSSSETKGGKHHAFLGKVKDGFEKAKEGLKEDYGKAKEEIKSILHKGKSHEDHDNEQLLDTKPNTIVSSTNDDHKKTPSIDDVKAPNLAQRLQEEVVAVISTIDEAKKGSTSREESKEIKEEVVKKEDNCMSSLAQGLKNMCSWGSKKED
ncbi:hypothetical protein vseg_000701 [Gypsophila vaccaria]